MAGKRWNQMAAAQAVAAILFTVMMVSACGQSPPPPATITRSPSPKTPTQTPSRTLTPILTPRYTLTSTFTPRPTYDDTARAWLTAMEATHADFATHVGPVTQTAMAAFAERCPVYDHAKTSFEVLISPDGNWLAQDCWGADWRNPDEFELLVTRLDGGLPAILPYTEIFRRSDFDPYSELSLRFLFWSPDSQSLYFLRVIWGADTSSYYGHFGMNLFAWPLYRLNVQTGDWARVIDSAYYYSLSPTGRRLAYVTLDPDWQNERFIAKMNILDLHTGALKTIDHENALAAAYVIWSADGLRMYYSVVNGPPDYGWPYPPFDYQIFEFDIASGQRTLLKSYTQSLAVPYPIGFTADGKLILQLEKPPQRDLALTEYFTEYLDLTTKQIITLTSTP